MNMVEFQKGGLLLKYRSPDWALVLEGYMGLQAAIIGLTGGINVGPLGKFLHTSNATMVWSLIFIVFGLGLFITATMENYRRRHNEIRDCSWKRYSQVRELFAAALVPCWLCGLMLFVWSGYTLILVPALSLQSLGAMGLVLWENIDAQHNPKLDRRSESRLSNGPGIRGI